MHISLSHSGEYAAAIVSDRGTVGIDIEKRGPRILRVAERFMTPGELENARGEYFQDKLYIHWCTKEAVYKMLGDPGSICFVISSSHRLIIFAQNQVIVKCW